MRALAWLNATPKPPAGSKRAKNPDAAPKLTRAEQMKATGITPKMPRNPMPHIIERLAEIGFSEAAGMGVGPLTWTTIASWTNLTGVQIAAWEARLFRHLSLAYVTESRRAEDENCPAPWRAPVSAKDRSAEDAALRALLR